MASGYKLIKEIPERYTARYLRNLCQNPHPAAMGVLDWYIGRVDWHALSSNPAAGHILRRNLGNIVWDQLSKNPCDDALYLLEMNVDCIDWKMLSTNTNDRAIRLLENHPYCVNWRALSRNPNPLAIDMLLLNKDEIWMCELMSNPGAIGIIRKVIYRWANREAGRVNTYDAFEYEWDDSYIFWNKLSSNPHPEAIKILMENFEKIDWNVLSANPAAIDVLRANPDRINVGILSSNPAAGDLLYDMIEEDPSVKRKVKTASLSRNPGMIRLLKKHRDLRLMDCVWQNPGIFEYDYDGMYSRCNVYKEEMMARIAHHVNAPCFQWLGWDEENVFELEPRGHLIVKPE